MPRQVWIDQPNQSDPLKLGPRNITDPIFDARWLAQLSNALEFLKAEKTKYDGNPGAFFCAQGTDSLGAWPSPPTKSGPAWADWVADTMLKIAPGTHGDFPCVHLNAEHDDVTGWQMPMLKRWRKRAPKRLTIWSPVAHKATLYRDVGWELAALNVVVAPQCYVGANNDRVDSANEVQAWVEIGVPAKRVWPFLFGSQLGAWWGEVNGAIVFTQGQIP